MESIFVDGLEGPRGGIKRSVGEQGLGFDEFGGFDFLARGEFLLVEFEEDIDSFGEPRLGEVVVAKEAVE